MINDIAFGVVSRGRNPACNPIQLQQKRLADPAGGGYKRERKYQPGGDPF